ncbi:unnamed protein product [Echinostoma caproni]|uniref:Transmembrane protein n=1 Tax=Echinostoma caproni TaxID=27848 RepID=A0A183AB06_9TREM|nr:unnamed protein product [Echinostoma caproni]
MDNGTSEIELFVRFPGSARSLIERCVGSVASQWAEDILNAELNDSAGSDFTWIIGKQLSHLHTVLGRHLKPRNGSWLDLELDQNCPTMHSHSTIAHASLAVGTAALLIHILLVFSVNHGLVRLYGPCLLTSIGLTAAHNLLLFASSYIPTNLAVHLRFTGEAMHTPANAQTILCTMVDAVLHYLSISVHLSTLFALFEQYHISKGAYTKTSGSSEVVFKRNDPLSRLKLDNLVMQLPLGIVRGGAYMPRNSSFTMPGLNLLGPPGSGGSTVPRKSGLTQGGGACRSSPTSCSPLTEAVHNVYGKQHLSVG